MKIEQRVNLRPYLTLRNDAQAAFFVDVDTISNLSSAMLYARTRGLPTLILGGGSNVVIGKAGFDGMVIHLTNWRYSLDVGRRQIIAGSATPMEELVTQTTERAWAGLEWAGGLPGTLGGAIRGNAGAFGGDTKDSIVDVLTVDPTTGETTSWAIDDCDFGYRYSIFKDNGQIIWQARLQFNLGDRAKLIETRDEKIAYRKSHHPQEPSVGSVFQNILVDTLPEDFFKRFPELELKVRARKLPAGALLDQLQMKGKTVGGIVVSDKHANIPINTGNGTGSDLRELANHMKSAVKDFYGVELHEEPQFILAE